jgi:hypothetical protein
MKQSVISRLALVEHLMSVGRPVLRLRVEYAAFGAEPPLAGPTYTYVMSADGQWRREGEDETVVDRPAGAG